MLRLPTADRVLALTAVLYLCFAGWFFVLAPWGPFWGALVVPNTPWWLLRIVDSPALRGALTGFGLLHFPVAAWWLASAGRRA